MEKIKNIVKIIARKILPGNSPNFIIIGAQKSATTSLHYYLDQHPDLIGSKQKELHFFDRLMHHGYRLKWYKKNFINFSLKPKIFFESTPSYIYHQEVPLQLKSTFPTIKLILILRNPVDRAFSAWNMYKSMFPEEERHRIMKEPLPNKVNPIYSYFYDGRSEFPNFSETIEIEKKIMLKNTEKEPAILRRGLYYDQLQNYYKYFDKNEILILGFKDLIENLEETLKLCTRFLDVSDFDFKNVDKEPKNTRKYNNKMSDKERDLLTDFYQKPNEKLFDLLGYRPNW
ncbi:sulfotransferase [Mesonia sp. K7]|uniref:sulfotransferase family protein n=1 Tax=Mesonia sp. K7 TaxID=2218606 RepID=UPI000DA72CCA|nr:sulfotransferase [Mesonia sp. K7]PZD76606.1 hypothetical protein DNG35_11485 [Mesonia sp. K7]